MFNTISDALNYLFVQENKNKNLNNLKEFIINKDLYPKFKTIIITGTNGKGSVLHYLRNILKNIMHVGIFQSPHIYQYNERIMINDRMISNAEIMYYAEIAKQYSEEYNNIYHSNLSFFELTFIISLMYFKDREIDFAIYEVGIGGLHDTVNVLDSEAAIITNIGYDHMSKLGNTKEDIAKEKLGITRKNKILFTTENDLIKLFEDKCNKDNIKLINVSNDIKDIKSDINKTSFIYKNKYYELNMLEKFQAYNASLAIEVSSYFFNKLKYETIYDSLKLSYIPCRMEIIKKDPYIIVDGAHNISAIEKEIIFLKNNFNNKKIYCLFVALNDKEYKKEIKLLDEIIYKYYFVEFEDKRKLDSNILFNLTNNKKEIINNLEDFISNLKLNEDEILLVTGSLHFASNFKKIYNLINNK
jgi:dihydrofolate synthase/folylpolyglutamate synthase